MNIIVCMKQVPGTTAVKINPQTNTLIREGIESIINPFDGYALEEAVRLKERLGGIVKALSMGPPQAEAILKEAISLGADETILLSDSAFAGADTWATAFTLASAIKKMGPYDLVVCGRQTLDGDTGQVGPELAEMLGIPFVAYVCKIEEISDKQARLKRMIDEGYEILETPIPAVITVTKEINVPRLPSLRGTIKAKKAVVPVCGIKEMGIDKDNVGLSGSYTRVIKIFSPQRTRKAEVFKGELNDQVECLIARLKDTGLV
jgi:electron transfer flavoprotein beta subunit